MLVSCEAEFSLFHIGYVNMYFTALSEYFDSDQISQICEGIRVLVFMLVSETYSVVFYVKAMLLSLNA